MHSWHSSLLRPTSRRTSRAGRPRGAAAAATAIAAVATVVGCTTNESSSGSGALSVSSTADACVVSSDEATSGNVVFEVTNDGTEVTEFYLLADDGLRIIGEVENIGPGITRNLVVQAAAGAYLTVCKPGMVGDGIRAPFTVTGSGEPVASGASGDVADLLATATEQYRLYVRDQVDQLVDHDRRLRRALPRR